MTDITKIRPENILEACHRAYCKLQEEFNRLVEKTASEFRRDLDVFRAEHAAIAETVTGAVKSAVEERFDELYDSQRAAIGDMRVKAGETALAFDRRFLELERRMIAECERLAAFIPPKDGEPGDRGEQGPPGKDGKGEKGDPGPAGLSFAPLGKFDETKAYHFRDVVAWNGGSWCAMRQTKAGEEPGVEADEHNPAWMGFSQRGRPGKPGERGLQGKPGERGERGLSGERGERGASIAAIAFDGWRLRVVDSDGVELDAAPFDAMRSLFDDLMSRIEAIELRGG